jgi:hypothetical protein
MAEREAKRRCPPQNASDTASASTLAISS